MKKLILGVLLSLVCTGSIYAQNHQPVPMRGIVTATLMDYGVMLFDRRFYPDAEDVFNRVLFYDPNHQGALSYLEKINPKAKRLNFKPVKTVTIPDNIQSTDLSDKATIEELRARIAKKNTEISTLKTELTDISAQSANTSSAVPAVDNPEQFDAYLNGLKQDLNQLRHDVDNQRP